jgi:hypothetical protein
MATNAKIFEVRTLIRDPIDSFNSIVEVANVSALPETPIAQTLYYVTDIKEYQLYEDGEWERQDIVVSNERIGTLYDLYSDANKASAKLVNDLIVYYGQLAALAYKSTSNGSETFDKQTLSDILAFYRSLRDSFKEESAEESGSSTGYYAVTKKPNIGGMDL